MKRASKGKRAAVKSVPTFALSARDASILKVVDNRLQRCCDLMSCLEYCQEAELNVGPLAIAARDLLDVVIRDLALLRRRLGKAVQP